jgi:hypothetical protein
VGKSPNPGGVLSISAKVVNGTETITSPTWNVSMTASTGAGPAATTIVTKIINPATAAVVTNQISGSTVTVQATVLLSDGTPVANQLVTFKLALDLTLVSMSPATGNALTNSSGVASVNVFAIAPSIGGPYSIEASATVSGASITSGASNVLVGAAASTLGTPSPLPANSSATIQLPITSNGVPVSGIPVSAISASSPCASQSPPKATITVVGINNGVASINYQNLGCTLSPDTVTINMAGALAPVNLSIPVSAAVGSKLTYIGATPASNVLVVKGAGGLNRVESGIVSFKLEDLSGSPVANQLVTFQLNTIAGGITLTDNFPITDALGVASVRVNSGTLPTPLTVLAKVVTAAGTFTAASSVLSISAGPPEQRSMSLSVSTRALEGWGIDGTLSNITIRMADYWGNSVPDQTAVSFIAEGGNISNPLTSNGSCLTKNGECTMVFRSQNSRPANGRVSILAYAEGIEGYTDANGNGVFDSGESCFHSGAPYLDNDESGTFNSGDLRLSNISPSSDTVKTPTPCTTRAATYVFAQTVVVLSSPAVYVTRLAPTSPSFANCSSVNYLFRVADINGNSVPDESTVSVADTLKVTAGTVYSNKVLLSPNGYATDHIVTLTPETASCSATTPQTASFNIVIKTPSGISSVFPVTIPY